MLLDVHAHVAYSNLYPAGYLSGLLEGAEGKIEQSNLAKFINLVLKDKLGDLHVKQMDEVSIEKSVLLILDAGIHIGEAKLSIEEIHEVHRNILERHPDRFIIFGSADPRRGKKGFNLFLKSISEFNFKGIKLYPPFGYEMTSDSLSDYYEVCNEKKLTVLIHTEFVKEKNGFSDPVNVKNIVAKYPDINFILAHALFNLTPELIKIIKDNHNLFFDISGYSSCLDTESQFLMECFAKVFENKIEDRILFGSDWPLFNLVLPLTVHIERLKALGIREFRSDFDYLFNTQMYNNARKALNI